MLIDFLAAANDAAPATQFGFWEAMEEGGPVAWFILGVMIIMSVGSFYILITKYFEQNKVMKEYRSNRAAFWRAGSLKDGATKFDKNSAWRQLVDDGIRAGQESDKMTDSLESHDWLHGTLARSEASINAKLAGGLPFLATVGATAPFVGLLGTVIGIYRALIKIGATGSASIDQVAGPVGEALIMTAIGLMVAVPAVFAYNYLQSRNRKIASMLSGFSTDLQANITSDGAVKPTLATAPNKSTAKAAPAKAAPAAKTPAAGTTAGAMPKPKS
ncbi:MotA/TolQ/ExbB proton channel family protein [Aurantiacibacter sediminis]|uniref:Biopolymer transport protein ExbB n=1 Tax=Aurantiacibacter sediminis TaxID=2793064 RepID=A0ABS0N0N6_9SPHN|nr:MotA/TolQ/ExbB proton channel family protein [Aurantiacibacter sediminis]MBH5321514.1 MotA/TolQ/ExbB proton channel family protein [Aurantiacibacter sediminis]